MFPYRVTLMKLMLTLRAPDWWGYYNCPRYIVLVEILASGFAKIIINSRWNWRSMTYFPMSPSLGIRRRAR
jgi:hypothetical protein